MLCLIGCVKPAFDREAQSNLTFWQAFIRIPNLEDDWSRLLRNASRVKHLVSGCSIPKAVFQIFDQNRPSGRSLFPNLATLRWEDPRGEILPFIHLFFGPSLLHFYSGVFLSRGLSEDPEFLEILSHTSPNLRSLQYQRHCPYGSPADGAIEIACSFVHLQVLDCEGQVSRSAITHLTCLPELRDLRFRIGSKWRQTANPSTTKKLCFSALQKLRVSSVDDSAVTVLSPRDDNIADFMAEFLGSIHTPYLHHLAVDETLSQWTEIAVITLLEDISRHVHLQELRICLRRIVTTSFTSIETLFGLTRLRSLSLQGIDFLLENDTIQQFGRAWPTLETFRLDWAPYQGDPSLFTLDALELFAIHLPHLNKITVYLDATHLPPSPSSNYRDVSTIRPDIGVDFSLGVSRSPVKESIATQIAEYIARIYPHANIQSLDFNSSEESKRQNKIWREIDRMVVERRGETIDARNMRRQAALHNSWFYG